MKLTELAHHLNTYLEIDHFEEAAYNGIQVANSCNIAKVATAVSASLETIEQAVALNVQALIVHHGIFRKQDAHPLVDTLYKKIKLLMAHDIALLAYHLPLDAHQQVGNNWTAAQALGLHDLLPFGRYNGQHIGVIGSQSATTFDAFKEKVEQYYGRSAQAVKVKEHIKRIAIISGGADKSVREAAQAGADCFITGRVDEPVWDDAHEQGISFLGLGHYATETVGPKALGEYIKQALGIPSVFIKTENPF